MSPAAAAQCLDESGPLRPRAINIRFRMCLAQKGINNAFAAY